ncbi:hypothetical protein N7468_002549 [Penicillium chermesinum]|uniref:NAD-dependent epimerase/dehydratase domain-containing protein n=1 Tax=Penicillium chermesinum TaxID=63820 RepID=A0A9W9TXM7_9EURO|nr:uncharacterized protein N7468_002549 [Penicillium chermesinum]KAJ5247566.1 hypothetical protein N7468_002549 [Penicillium chermesinum]KAJ6145801.1 hypothetical protein N7470_009696 [Penicillium chermesinum]
MDLRARENVVEYVVSKDIDTIVHTATCIDKEAVSNLIIGLEKRRQATGKESHYVHTSGLSAFDEVTGWPFGPTKDSDAVYEMEKQTEDAYIVRHVDTYVIDQCEAAGVKGYLVFPPTIHGRGSGAWNQLSPQMPAIVRASIEFKKVHKFAEERDVPSILDGKDIPSGRDGYYFIESYTLSWWDILGGLAQVLYARGLVSTPATEVWPSDEMVAQAMDVPVKFAYSIWNPGNLKIICDRKNILGWEPAWSKEKFLGTLNSEVDDFLELGMPKSSLLSSLKPGHNNGK